MSLFPNSRVRILLADGDGGRRREIPGIRVT
jgi:hypothetical protein